VVGCLILCCVVGDYNSGDQQEQELREAAPARNGIASPCVLVRKVEKHRQQRVGFLFVVLFSVQWLFSAVDTLYCVYSGRQTRKVVYDDKQALKVESSQGFGL